MPTIKNRRRSFSGRRSALSVGTTSYVVRFHLTRALVWNCIIATLTSFDPIVMLSTRACVKLRSAFQLSHVSMCSTSLHMLPEESTTNAKSNLLVHSVERRKLFVFCALVGAKKKKREEE